MKENEFAYIIYAIEPNTYSGGDNCGCCLGGLKVSEMYTCKKCQSHKEKCRPLQYHWERRQVVCYTHGARKALYKGDNLYTCVQDGHSITVKLRL